MKTTNKWIRGLKAAASGLALLGAATFLTPSAWATGCETKFGPLNVTVTPSKTSAGPGEVITYTICVSNSSASTINNFAISEDLNGDLVDDVYLPVGQILAGEQICVSHPFTMPASGSVTNLVNVFGGDPIPSCNEAIVVVNVTGDGCSAKFWKDNKSKWVGYSPDAKLKDTFAKASDKTCKDIGKEGDKKLIDALGAKDETGFKGAFKTLMREAVAALLNAANPAINYPATEAEILLMVNDALTTCNETELRTLAAELLLANSKGSTLCKTGGTSTGNCTTDGRPNLITFGYTGGSCASAVNSQQPPAYTGKYSCSETNGGLTGVPARIIVTASSTPPTAATARYFDGIVNVGGDFNVSSTPIASTFGANTYVYIYEGDVLKQRIGVHTSCSAPLVRGETFGGLILEDYAIVP